MDIVDQSDVEIENTINDIIMKNSSPVKSKRDLTPRGICHNEECESEIAAGKLFCNGDCATAHHKRSQRSRR